jgi:catechol 2,3-dioxygenase-like lactoylglutathione lyase family enzyme
LVQNVDCIRLRVSDLDAGLVFYRDRLGHELIWCTDEAAGLRLSDSEAEIVLHAERADLEVDLKVRSAEAAALRFQGAGGTIIVPPFDIQIGRAGGGRRGPVGQPTGAAGRQQGAARDRRKWQRHRQRPRGGGHARRIVSACSRDSAGI